MAPGRLDAPSELSLRSGDMVRVLTELQESGIVYFQSSITRSRDRNGHKFGTDVQLVLPPSFLQEHGGNFEEYVIFRTRTSAKPWIVQVSIFEEPDAVAVRFAGEWEEFAADNRLKPGDSLIFVLKVPLPEFMVYIFRESGTTPSSARNRVHADHFTRVSEQKAGSLSHGRREEPEKNVRITGDSLVEKKEPVHEAPRQQDLPESARGEVYNGQNLGDSFSEIDTGNERKDLASRHGTDSFPNFEKRITTTIIHDNLIEIPASFARTHGMELQADIEVQESPVHMVKLCWRRLGTQERLFLKAGWRNFFKENGLRVGQQLRFTLKAASFLVVRRVSIR